MQGQVSMMYELCMASPLGARCHHVETCLVSCDRCYIARLAVVPTDEITVLYASFWRQAF